MGKHGCTCLSHGSENFPWLWAGKIRPRKDVEVETCWMGVDNQGRRGGDVAKQARTFQEGRRACVRPLPPRGFKHTPGDILK